VKLLCLPCLAILACSSKPPRSSVPADDLPQRFDDLAAAIVEHLDRLDPAEAVSLGRHTYDGKLPDRSPAALDQAVAQLTRARRALATVELDRPGQQLERDVLLQRVRRELFERVDMDLYRTNPMAYSSAVNLASYIVRDYAPIVERAQAVIDLCTALPGFLAVARRTVRTPIPKPWIDTALLQARGLATFADVDVRRELGAIVDTPLRNQAEIGPALDTCKAALGEHVAWLEQQQLHGTDAFALGEARFLKMLAETQGVELDLAKLAAIAEADLKRNTDAIAQAAGAIDPARAVTVVVADQANDKPAASEVLELATQQADDMRRFIVANRIVSVPSEDVALVRESPPFQRWNSAFLDGPGPFEQKKLPSYYYISPPDPKWPAAEQRAYIPPRDDLLFTTIHEVWPGHFLHHLHIQRHPSQILQSYCTYSMSEGWAHYAEEMMFDAGAGGRTPQARIGMLKEALLRNVRFVVAIGEHAQGMSVDRATALFAERGFVDPGNARQQAVRGTFDPMFLAYTLGKLIIRKLRDDWTAKHPGASLGEFHDQLLAYGCAPLPVIRRAMLGDDAGPVL
jgi:uncharacterized protein (DUF885 family)